MVTIEVTVAGIATLAGIAELTSSKIYFEGKGI
jgi:hypothetical protein